MRKSSILKLFTKVLKMSSLIIIILSWKSLDNSSIVKTRAIQKDHYSLLKQEYQNFLTKYESNSCIMKIFSIFSPQCDELDDKVTSEIAFRMTLCFYSSLGKDLDLNCDIQNISECIQKMKGDMWTSFVTFSQHVDNLCFYYKTVAWEKSSEYLFFKLLNSSVNVLSELNQSYVLAEKMYSEQEKFSSQMEQNLADTLKNFQVINQFFDNYTLIEEKVKDNMNLLEEKIILNNEKILNTVKYVDEKFQMIKTFFDFFNTKNDSNSFLFFFSLFTLVWISTFSKKINGIKIHLNVILILSFLFEKFIVVSYQNYKYYEIEFIYYNLIFYFFRIVYFLILFVTIVFRLYTYKKNESGEFKKEKANDFSSEYKILITMTPMWIKKYFNKMKMQNEYLIEKFNTMEELMEKEKFNIQSGTNFKFLE